ncbi:uncharacterized protein [Halyomorpha halys]|uniref:uncharacterized protein n=1 Tax=Halyomorpha halys TaxID=286706 RepID=UPI0006D51940|nr:uncharacterized protein LOC106690748 [Halyomorpha halys]
MVSRPPHTIPYSSGRKKYEERDRQLARIQKVLPLTHDIIKFIVGDENFGDSQSEEVSGDVVDIGVKLNNTVEEAQFEMIRNTWTDRRAVPGRVINMDDMSEMIDENEEIDEVREDSIQYLVTPTEILSSSEEEFLDEESEENVLEEPLYDMESRARELTEQEEEFKNYVQEFYNDIDLDEVRYNELKKLLNRGVKKALSEAILFDDEDDEEFLLEDIVTLLNEEDISSIESIEEEEE